MLQNVMRLFAQDEDFNHVLASYQKGIKEQLVAGLSGSARSLFISTFYQETDAAILLVTHNLYQAQKIYEDLLEWLDEEEVLLYPVNDLISSEIAIASPELKAQRIEVLNKLLKSRKKVVIVPLAGIRRFLPPVQEWKKSQLSLVVGEDIELDKLQQKLHLLGYERVEMVEKVGEYSIRGGIVDICPPQHAPLRLELFDTEIESIRSFDLATQRSLKAYTKIEIGPCKELLLGAEHFQQAAAKISVLLEEQLKKVTDPEVKENLASNIKWEIEQLENEQDFQGSYKYIQAFYKQAHTLLDYMPANTVVMLDEPTRLKENEEQYHKEELDWQKSLLQTGEYLPNLAFSMPFEQWKRGAKQPFIHLALFLRQVGFLQPQNIISFTAKAMQNFHSQMHILKGEIQRWKKAKQTILFLASNADRLKRMQRILEDFEIEVQDNTTQLTVGNPVLALGALQQGFELPLTQLVIVTEQELFTKQQRKKGRSTQSISNAERIKNYTELNVGDYVVHINHGIGKYIGIETLEIDGKHKDYLNIRYAGNDKLYVPVDQIDQIQKYIGGEEASPKLYSLGGNDWRKVKSRVQSSVQDIAADLIKLYAERAAAPGYAFSKDSEMHQEFDALFPYQETEDQIRAIKEIKQDMEQSRPMDRLLCGDVGYGKTEVAIRAAFKAVMDGKQVAVLVPTTILAQQHYETFRERFNDYPIEIGVLSRFRSKKEQTQALKDLKDGVLDIIIGTHRVLSKDVQFRDLGLLIVDEEQRFGVTHKEKVKQLKKNIDVLTLTATPIPRTLHMSMLGVRDLSVIETPPENRFPVQTYVVEYNGALIREAIERELARGGQVYFLFNQVQGIERMAEQIRFLVPDARVATAHGQMKEAELENVMISFLEGEFDVLVSTTIIETGVDIPNVNTLIIYNADKMGLSQLYQLRGRVGRSNRMAYAYFTYERDKVLTEVAEKRLQAIKEFTELGSGFKIAMRDLAIRGAGNLLGAEQHGFIASVGFDLYSQMLKEAIDELKGEVSEKQETTLEFDLQVDAYIPETYIFDGKQKIEMYKRVNAARTIEDVEGVYEEFLDRFGGLPDPVERLLQVARLKAYAYLLHMDSMILKNDTLKMMFHPTLNDKIDGGRLFQIVTHFGRKFALSSDRQIGISFAVKGMQEDEWLATVVDLLSKINKAGIVKGENIQHVQA